MKTLRAACSILLSFTCAGAQELAIAPVRPSAPVIIRPYLPADVPPVRLANSPRLAELIRAGKLYLTAQDAVALALENDIDIEVARYNPILAAWRLERAEAGGALPGVPSNASQAGSVAAGQGVTGSQAAAGVSIAGAGTAINRNNNATISQIGPVTQTLDPSIQESTTFSHSSLPQPNVVQSLTPVLITNTHAYAAAYQQGFLTGGSVTVRYSENYLKENSPTDLLNPSVAPNLSISAQHNLLRGFGIAVNARQITIARMNLNTTELNFRTQVISIVAQVLDAYYTLSANVEDLKVKTTSVDIAKQLLANVQEQIRLGGMADPERITTENQVATSRRSLVDSRAAYEQQQVRLKNMLSRKGAGDPVLAGVELVPVDTITIPAQDDLPPIADLVKDALAKRPDIASGKAGLESAGISALGTRNGVLPSLQVIGGESQAGLAGVPHLVPTTRGTFQAPDPYFAGGIGTGLGQVFRRNFPTERIGFFFQASLHNRQAQADYAIDQLQLRQSQLTNQKDLSQVEVDVRNSVIALRQARVRYDSAVESRKLSEELLKGEQERLSLGASTPYNVIQQQRDLSTALFAETSARVSYSQARILLDQTLGRTLEVNGINIAEARSGKVSRTSGPAGQ